ncbi:MAG TPA: penicillin acylase family protein [Candidatus Limnocylindrales bacterium]|nr:penicillin acylase family protein [Candidatus Limnocylindrales bacterium]
MRKLAVLIAVLFAIVTVGTEPAESQSSQASAQDLESRAKTVLAQTTGTLQVKGLEKQVRVQRDHWGVAHIYAQNEHDLFFAQGFVVSQDRLFQMELWKRAGQGRLAEVLGPSAVQRDVNARLLQYRGDMDAEYKSYAPDTKEILEAFTGGINAYIAELAKDNWSKLPIEFQVAGFHPEPWKPEDCLNRMAAFSMTGNSKEELALAQVEGLVGPKKAASLFELDPPVQPTPAPGADFAGFSPKLLENLVGSDVRIQFGPKAIEGSNNWTISGKWTASGKPLLANDPHRVIAEPSLRYIVHLVAPGWDVIGAGEPGLPGVADGHNQNIAWGFTIFGLDQQDLYIEELNPRNPNEYRTEKGWEPFEVKTETIPVRGAAPVTVDLKWTRHGPVLWSDGKRALALRWVGDEPGTAGYLGSLALDRAQNWNEFESAMARWKVPSENIVYADREGNIGEHSTGLAPLRKNWKGLLPVPGVGGYEWAGFVPNSELPHSYNPAAGFVATANHKMIPEHYPYAVGFEWGSPERYLRIKEVIEGAQHSGHKLSIEDMEKLQSDVVSLPARKLQELLRDAAGASPSPAAKLLLDWNCSVDADSAAAALYELWVEEVGSAVSQAEMPQAARNAVGGSLSLPATIAALSGPDPALGGARDKILLDSLSRAEARLDSLEGGDSTKWSWGRLHTVTFRHSLDEIGNDKSVFDLGPVPRPGDGYTVNATGFRRSSFAQVAGASYREVFDLSDWDNSAGVNVAGQSGQPGSPHYGDLVKLWSTGRYFPLSYSRAAVNKQTANVLELTP